MGLFDLDGFPVERWPVIPGLATAAILRIDRIMRQYPDAVEIYCSDTPPGKIKKDVVCWDAGSSVLLWLVVPHGIEVPGVVLEELRVRLEADPAAGGREVAFGPALGEPQTGFDSSQQKLVRVETWRPGVEWVTTEEASDTDRRNAAVSATRLAEDRRNDAFDRLGRYPATPSYLD